MFAISLTTTLQGSVVAFFFFFNKRENCGPERLNNSFNVIRQLINGTATNPILV